MNGKECISRLLFYMNLNIYNKQNHHNTNRINISLFLN